MMSNDLYKIRRDAEWCFILCAISNTNYALKKCGGVPKSIFSDNRLGELWERIKHGDDVITAANDIDINLLSEISTRTAESYIDIDRIDEYEKIIWKAIYSMDALKVSAKLAELANDMKVDEIFDSYVNLSKVSPYKEVERNTLTPDELYKAYIENINTSTEGVSYLFNNLEEKIGKLRKGTLTFIAGRPGMGKTAFALNMSKNMAICGHSVLYFSLELDKYRIWERLLAGHCELSIGAIKNASIEYKTEKSNELAELLGNNFMICDSAYTPTEIQRECLIYSPEVIIIDHVDEMKRPDYSRENVWRSAYMKEIRDFAKKYGIAVVSVLQLNRSTDDRQDKRPILSDLRWDGGLEQVADIVLMCYSEEYYSNILKDEQMFELWVRKNRDGIKNVCVNMKYDLKTQTFTDEVRVINVNLEEIC